MGGQQRTAKNLLVFEIQPKNNLIYVVGAVPGKFVCFVHIQGSAGSWVRIKDSLGNVFKEVPPFPTYIPKPNLPLPERMRYLSNINII